MINVSIQGCCVIRDAIEFNNKDNLIKVDRFTQFINPMTMFGGAVLLTEDIFQLDKLKGNNFCKRCMEQDFKKKVFDYFGEVHSDYILLDVASLVMYYYALDSGINFTESGVFLNNENIILKALDITREELRKNRKTIFDISINEVKSIMKLYAKKVLNQYRPSQIILVELYMAEKYIDLETGMPVQWWKGMFPTIGQNCILKIAYEALKQELGPVNTIPFPNKTYGKVNHKWGKYQLHYQDEYYTYLWNEMMKIMLR